jgi:xanthine dehydrogenase iron-sulfur cluster and FAD-binding subunit A
MAQRRVSRDQFLHPLPADHRRPELVTVESLQAADGALHPVQQAMVDIMPRSAASARRDS